MLAGDGLLGEYFDDGANNAHLVNPAGTHVDPVIDFGDASGGAFSVSAGGRVEADSNFSIRWTGWVLVDQAGSWQFKTLSNDGVRLWVDNVGQADTPIIDRWNNHAVATDTANITLTAGWHPLRLEYYQQNASTAIELRYSGPGRSEVIIPQDHLSSTEPNANPAPVVDAGPNRNLVLPENLAELDGSASDDGQIVALLWTQLSGPNTATISDGDTEDAAVSDLVEGTYVFQLKATDDLGQMSTDTVSVTVVDPNLAPVVDAGPNRTVLLPDSGAMLDGTASDDGSIASYAWTQISGPNTAAISGADAEDATLSGLVQGTYVFQLKATDNLGKMASDTVSVHVVDPNNTGVITGDLMTWHNVTITFDGPETSETAANNPFLNYRLDVTFTHTASGKQLVVPGYYAADGNAANSHATSGNKWRVHFAPSEVGEWTYTASFRSGANVAVNDNPLAGASAGFFDGFGGTLNISQTDKTGLDNRGRGTLEYVGERYLKFAGTGEYFLKQGADAPENLLAYADFDGGFASDGQRDDLVKDWAPHVADWQPGDPAWDSEHDADSVADDGKGLIGAINYLASEGQNAFSFLTMNIGGDDKNVFPYLQYDNSAGGANRLQLDVSKLDQWEIVFTHGDTKGMFLHFKTLETENELLLDGGNLGVQRKLYYRELIARFSHHLALNWNLGEEINNASTAQKQSWANYFYENDPYHHLVVIHNGSNHYDLLGPYDAMAGTGSQVTGFSLQTSSADFSDTFTKVTNYLTRSADAGKQWPVALDEPGDAQHALRPDNDAGTSQVDGRKNALWGTLMAGGWGNEWYFGYAHNNSDLTLNDFRSRDQWWDVTRYALEFFNNNDIPFWEMNNDNALSSNTDDYAFVKPGDTYVVYLKNGGTTNLNLSGQTGVFQVQWYDPRSGGALQNGSVQMVTGGGQRALGTAPNSAGEDWAILVSRPDLPGDYDHSGTVDAQDYTVWRTDFGRSDKLDADGNQDGVVDAADYSVWRDNLGQTVLALAASAAEAPAPALSIVSEPVSEPDPLAGFVASPLGEPSASAAGAIASTSPAAQDAALARPVYETDGKRVDIPAPAAAASQPTADRPDDDPLWLAGVDGALELFGSRFGFDL
ncbi:PA14 domain protein [Pirellulimonas nuda]|uniref:PA14 domain protein n=2 Tax=Pirellulimonas nuda TaxID=2528009 RepID=A0A518D5R4_9BACT|nr:PA14 domain protein [Pirellulimonas nuda]